MLHIPSFLFILQTLAVEKASFTSIKEMNNHSRQSETTVSRIWDN